MKMSNVEAADNTEKVGGEAQQWSEVGHYTCAIYVS